jgi:conjugal transfer pilus assembly protein TraU
MPTSGKIREKTDEKYHFCLSSVFFVSPAPHADPSCEGRFVNPITDVCWRCIFPLSLGSVQVGKGDLPDTSNPGSPLQLCPAPPPIFVRPGLAIGYWEPMAMTDVSRSPGCMVNLGASVSISARPVWGPRERTISR